MIDLSRAHKTLVITQTFPHETVMFLKYIAVIDIPIKHRFCALVVRVPGFRSRGPSSIPGATRFSEE
jgi:hypothetical protein